VREEEEEREQTDKPYEISIMNKTDTSPVSLHVTLDHEGKKSDLSLSVCDACEVLQPCQSISPFIQLFLTLPNLFSLCVLLDGVVRAQSWLKGHVHATVNKAILCDKGKELTVSIKGKEITSFLPKHSEGNLLTSSIEKIKKKAKTTPHSPPQRYEHIVYDEKSIVGDLAANSCDNVVAPGTYSFPFSFYMPGHVPPSMHYEDKEGSSCSVRYTLNVDGCTSTFRPYSTVLTVMGKPLSCKKYPCLISPTCFPVKSHTHTDDHGFFVALGAKVENKHVANGKKVVVSLACRNKSPSDIERIDVHLMEDIEWKAQPSEPGSKTDGPHRLETLKLDSWSDVCLPSLKKEVEMDTSSSEKLGGDIVEATKANIVSDLKAASSSHTHTVLQLQVPMRAFDSYCGTLLRIAHYLRVDAVMADDHGFGRRTIHGLRHSIVIPLEVFGSPIEQMTPKVLSVEKKAEVETTNWPDDKEFLHEVKAHHHAHTDSQFSYTSINEDESEEVSG